MTNRDYVNSKKPSAFRIFWNKHRDDFYFWAIVVMIILLSGVEL